MSDFWKCDEAIQGNIQVFELINSRVRNEALIGNKHLVASRKCIKGCDLVVFDVLFNVHSAKCKTLQAKYSLSTQGWASIPGAPSNKCCQEADDRVSTPQS